MGVAEGTGLIKKESTTFGLLELLICSCYSIVVIVMENKTQLNCSRSSSFTHIITTL